MKYFTLFYAIKVFFFYCVQSVMNLPFFSSPEPKAHGELIVYQSSRRPCVRLCVRPCVNTFKHEYLRNQRADCIQILSEASLGWGKGCIRFLARSDWNSGFHSNG